MNIKLIIYNVVHIITARNAYIFLMKERSFKFLLHFSYKIIKVQIIYTIHVFLISIKVLEKYNEITI